MTHCSSEHCYVELPWCTAASSLPLLDSLDCAERFLGTVVVQEYGGTISARTTWTKAVFLFEASLRSVCWLKWQPSLADFRSFSWKTNGRMILAEWVSLKYQVDDGTMHRAFQQQLSLLTPLVFCFLTRCCIYSRFKSMADRFLRARLSGLLQ